MLGIRDPFPPSEIQALALALPWLRQSQHMQLAGLGHLHLHLQVCWEGVHGPVISGLHIHQRSLLDPEPAMGPKPWLLSMTTPALGFPLLLRLHLTNYLSWNRASVTLHNPSSSNTELHERLTHYHPEIQSWPHSGPQCVCWPHGNTSQRFCLNDTGLFLSTANFPVPADQHQYPRKAEVLFSVSGLVNHSWLSPSRSELQILLFLFFVVVSSAPIS